MAPGLAASPLWREAVPGRAVARIVLERLILVLFLSSLCLFLLPWRRRAGMAVPAPAALASLEEVEGASSSPGLLLPCCLLRTQASKLLGPLLLLPLGLLLMLLPLPPRDLPLLLLLLLALVCSGRGPAAPPP